MKQKITTLQSFLSHFPVVSRVKVRWGDMDAFQHVNNCNYFRFQEDARLQFFRDIVSEVNPNQTEFDAEQYNTSNAMGPILADTYCKFKFPVTYPDTLLVGATISSPSHLVDKSYTVSHTMWSLEHNIVVAEGYSKVVNYDFRSKKSVAIPPALQDAIHEVLKRNNLHMMPKE